MVHTDYRPCLPYSMTLSQIFSHPVNKYLDCSSDIFISVPAGLLYSVLHHACALQIKVLLLCFSPLQIPSLAGLLFLLKDFLYIQDLSITELELGFVYANKSSLLARIFTALLLTPHQRKRWEINFIPTVKPPMYCIVTIQCTPQDHIYPYTKTWLTIGNGYLPHVDTILRMTLSHDTTTRD